jgi:hypothetical protein
MLLLGKGKSYMHQGQGNISKKFNNFKLIFFTTYLFFN